MDQQDFRTYRLRDALAAPFSTGDWQHVRQLLQLIPPSIQGCFVVLSTGSDTHQQLAGIRLAPDAGLDVMNDLMERVGKRPSRFPHSSASLNERLSITGPAFKAMLEQKNTDDIFEQRIDAPNARELAEQRGAHYGGTYTLACLLRDARLSPIDHAILEEVAQHIPADQRGLFLCDTKEISPTLLQLTRLVIDPQVTLAQLDKSLLKPVADLHRIGDQPGKSFDHMQIRRSMTPDELIRLIRSTPQNERARA